MNTTELISSIKLKGAFPDDDYFTTTEYLTILNESLQTQVLPLMLQLSEEYLLQDKDYTISSSAVYRIPKRAIGAKLRDVKVYDSSGNYTNLYRLVEEDRSSNNTGYYISRNKIELSSSITSGTLRLTYFLQPPTLVATSSCGQITSIDTNNNQVVVSSAPSTFITDAEVDIIQNSNPHDVISFENTISAISGTTITFNSTLPSDLTVGDWVCISGQAPVALIPTELENVLVQSALCLCLSAKKDKSVEFETQKLEQLKNTMINLLDPRVESGNDNKFRGSGLLGYIQNR